jgi:hypothetical protein
MQYFRTALGSTQPPIQWVPWALSLRVKRPGREAGHSPLSSAEVKECVELCLHSSNTPSWHGAQLKKYRENFTFICEIWGYHSGEDSGRGLLGCDVVSRWGRIRKFRRNILTPWIWKQQGPPKRWYPIPQHYTTLQPGRPGLESFLISSLRILYSLSQCFALRTSFILAILILSIFCRSLHYHILVRCEWSQLYTCLFCVTFPRLSWNHKLFQGIKSIKS